MPIPQIRYGRHGNRQECDCYLQDNQLESLLEVPGHFLGKTVGIGRSWPEFETSIDGKSDGRLFHCLPSPVAEAVEPPWQDFLLLDYGLVTRPQCAESDGHRLAQQQVVDLKPFVGMDL